MTLIIENVNDDLAKIIRAVAKPFKAKVKRKKELSVNGYTKEFEEKLLKELKETQDLYLKGKIKAYDDVKKMHQDILNEV
ncbi:hypothetical protein CAV_0288 [Campylobacter avium LMG 24591]|uniref:Uncharacterized protein n=2 Tax=Campylobacter avium TaxID=522485 RepID=A0A222MVL9_9BACT|nr:hypothetical protein [Campylobacter avium]ASQ29959.1 hypothetical protein CAV_0288 [Campylobacter avium LMG 24591]OYD79058.1 hypothetical protein CAV8706_0290 [Campylobacter avium]